MRWQPAHGRSAPQPDLPKGLIASILDSLRHERPYVPRHMGSSTGPTVLIDRSALIDLLADLGLARDLLQVRSARVRWCLPPLLVGSIGAVAALFTPADWGVEPTLLLLNAVVATAVASVAVWLDLRLCRLIAGHVRSASLTISPALPAVCVLCCYAAVGLYLIDPQRIRLALLLSTTPMAVCAFAALANTQPIVQAYRQLSEKAASAAAALSAEGRS